MTAYAPYVQHKMRQSGHCKEAAEVESASKHLPGAAVMPRNLPRQELPHDDPKAEDIAAEGVAAA